MIIESARHHFNFKIYSQIGKILGITPSGNNVSSIVFPLIVMISVFCILIIAIASKLKADWHKPATVVALDILESCYECFFIVSITGSTICNLKNWKSFLKHFITTKIEKSNKYKLCFDFKMLLFVLVFSAIHYASFRAWMDCYKLIPVKYVLHTVTNIYECFYLMLVWQILLILKDKYKKLNEFLKNRLAYETNPNKLQAAIVETSFLYRKNGETVGYFNMIFGWSLIWFFASTLVNILHCINFIMLKFPTHQNVIYYKCLLLLIYTCFYTVSLNYCLMVILRLTVLGFNCYDN